MTHFYLFAYGTLRDRNRSPGRELLEGCERVGVGEVRGAAYDAGSYPALVLDGTGRVPGTVWRCPADTLHRLDAYEGVADGLFRRVATRVADHACWVYVAGPSLGERLRPDHRLPTGAVPAD